AALELWNAWAAPDFIPGEGVLGQDPSIDPRAVSALFGPPLTEQPAITESDLSAASAWIPASVTWTRDDPAWTWGLAPAERAAAWALLFLDDVADEAEQRQLTADLDEARSFASQQVLEGARQTKLQLYQAFRRTNGNLAQRASSAFATVNTGLIQEVFVGL